MLGYVVLVWYNFKYGILIKFIGGLLTIPFAIELKLWDVLILCGFFGVIELAKVIQLYFLS
jgi:hypothetical protein